MKQFFKMMFASILGAFVTIGLLMLIGVVMLVGIVSSIGNSSAVYIPGKEEKIFRLSLNGRLTDVAAENPFGSLFGSDAPLSLKDVLAVIGKAKEDDRIEGIYLDVTSLSTGTASVDAIRRALLDFRGSGKFIVAYADNYTQRCYYLSSVADKVFLNPQGILELSGFASQTTFYRGILKKAGIDMQVFKVGTYKGAVEPFMLDRLSDENREQITSYQQGVWNNMVANIAEARGISKDDVNGFADNGYMFSAAEKALEYGLVDDLKYREEAENYVKELVGIETDKRLKTISLARMKNIRTSGDIAKRSKTNDQIAVVYAEGEIVASDHLPAYSESGYITETLADELVKLKNNKDVKAVVMRVNSPGGSGYVSEQIWKQVNELRERKKVVVSMGNVAASGGYYISCAADKIIAEANTLTGSIGVFGLFPNAGGLYDKLDVTTDVVKTNLYADFGDISRPMRHDEKALVQAYVERFYDLFLTRCSDGRAMTKDEVDAVAQGRVWTGEQALGIGLVDELGDLDRAIEVAAELAELEDYNVKTILRLNDPLTNYLKKQMGEMKSSVVTEALGKDAELFRMLQTIKRANGLQARLPYGFEPL